MFVRAKVLYIVGDDVGNSFSIDESLTKTGIKSKFFNTNPNVLSSNGYSNFLKKLPPETVFAVKIVSRNNSNNTPSFLISIPFVSSHLGLPIKIGETIWLQEINEISDVEKFYEINAYYLGRAHSYFTTEDTGYCYSDREEDIFNISKKSFNASRIEKSKNVKQKLNTLKEATIRANSVFTHNTVSKNKELDYLNNKSSYITKSIDEYDIRPITKFIKKSEDSVFQGTYNNMISLSSENDKFESNSRHGNIELIVGHGEYTKNEPPEEFEFDQVSTNNNKLSEKIKIRKFNTDIAGFQIWNGIHYETVKSDMSFVNEGVINKLGLNNYELNFLNDKNAKSQSYNGNAASFNISEYNTKSIEIQKNNLPLLSDITGIDLDFLLNSNIKDKNVFTIKVPATYPDLNNNILDSFYGGSSITGISDSIILCTHKNLYSANNNIKLIQTNSDDGYSTQISLNPSGNILLDGHKILIGSYDRLNGKQNGKSAMVYLGHSNENQSLVLGERLNDFLEEILKVQIEVFRLLKESLIKLNQTDTDINNTVNDLLTELIVFGGNAPTFVGPAAPVGVAVTNLTTALVKLSPVTTQIGQKVDEEARFINEQLLIKKDEEYSLRIQRIINNLELLLSKFTKTS